MRIGVIDSGVGGLSILNAVRESVPAQYIYCMDNQYLPYGTKSELFIRQRLQQLTHHLLEQYKVDLVLIACNTATTQAVDYLRQQFALPFVGVVPAIKPAAHYCGIQPFAVLATQATVNGPYIEQLVAEFAPKNDVQLIASSELVLLAEQKVWYRCDVTAEVRRVLLDTPLAQSNVAALVLGCTHFPFLTEEIRACLGQSVRLFDTAEAIARRVKQLQLQFGFSQPEDGVVDVFVSTAELDLIQQGRLAELGFGQHQCWPNPAGVEQAYSSVSSLS
ncbi:glutamate racemase [Rheinheimera sp.]|uniref:glutamate racemase n=1 Tax=Rheinheimera sp. TaxID=1869214 RepID=UPI00307DE46F